MFDLIKGKGRFFNIYNDIYYVITIKYFNNIIYKVDNRIFVYLYKNAKIKYKDIERGVNIDSENHNLWNQ